jgi:hypothetical protein
MLVDHLIYNAYVTELWGLDSLYQLLYGICELELGYNACVAGLQGGKHRRKSKTLKMYRNLIIL